MATSSTTGRVIGSRGMQGLTGFLGPRAMTNDSIPAPNVYPSSVPLTNRDDIYDLSPKMKPTSRGKTFLKDSEDSSIFGTKMYHAFRAAVTKTEPQDVEVIVTPPPPAAPLLLEGDEFYVSHSGIARTYYELVQPSGLNPMKAPFTVEELYDLERAAKMFVLRREPSETSVPIPSDHEVLSRNAEGVARLGEALTSFKFQEIDHGVFGSAGTGSTTWESSIAMAMFFSMHPDLLQGDVIELGSGVGLGGIMSQAQHPPLMKSITLTDGNREVLSQCRDNVLLAQQSQIMASGPPLQVGRLNWYDFTEGKERSQVTDSYSHKYDTVIASDCAYRYPDLVALSHTMEKLLRQNEKSRVHVFGPYNRSALRELVALLRDKRKMFVVVEEIDMKRYRLKPPKKGKDGFTHAMVQHKECTFASKNVSKFLHITASLPQKRDDTTSTERIMEDID